MLFTDNLNSIIFQRHNYIRCDELIVLSGYVGPNPVHQLNALPLKTTVIYGMYGSEGIKRGLHNELLLADNSYDNVNIFYSTFPVHSKCYIWKDRGEVVHALIGSANFSNNGLFTPDKEVLAETTSDTFGPLNKYFEKVMETAISCRDASARENDQLGTVEENSGNFNPDVCSMPLFDIKNGVEVVNAKSGINWGMASLSGSHVNINDAYIPIDKLQRDYYPQLFPMKQNCPSTYEGVARPNHRHNDSIEIIWDDGTTMEGLLEGTVTRTIDGKKLQYPKQISSTPRKAVLGEYLRARIGVPEGRAITIADLERYGRKTIDISLQGEGIYYFDFSVGASSQAISTINEESSENQILTAADQFHLTKYDEG